MRKLFHKFLVFINIFLAMGLLLAYLSVYVSPARFWFLALIGLAYPIFLLGNLAFLFYWIIRWKWEFLLSFFVIALGVGHLSSFFQFAFGRKPADEKPDLTLLSYNVNLFRLYYWSDRPPTHKEILNYARLKKCDVVCFQEFYTENGRFNEREAISHLKMNAHVGYIVQRKNSAYGIATFTKYPIVNRGEIRFENTSNACIYTDIKVGNDTIRVYNNHLQSLRLKERNLRFLMNKQSQGNNVDEIKEISLRLRDAFIKRAQQVNLVAAHVRQCKYPVIVCGDFNDSPISYTYRTVSKGLSDTFKEVGKGLATTYQGLVPSYRIDYILHSKNFKAIRFSSPRVNYSDHFPVIGEFKLMD